MTTSYYFISKALEKTEATVVQFAHVGTHFLHESLKQIVMRIQERETMKLTSASSTSVVLGHTGIDSVAKHVSDQKNQAISQAILTELSATSLKEDQFTPPVKSKQFQPRPAFMRGNESEHQLDLTNTPRFRA